jgi:hypothetical protein
MSVALDHLVFAARTLDEGVAWCEATFDITPGPGGKHPLMGTHNRLFSIATAGFPQAYVEIIAVDPQAPPPGRPRWFDLDQPAMHAALTAGPQLIHWVARTSDIRSRLSTLRAHGFDGGEVIAAERDTPAGRLHWHIGVRLDGRRLCGGALPTWIEWGKTHPTDNMVASGVVLHSLGLAGVPAELSKALDLPAGITATATPGAPALQATFTSPQGPVVLRSPKELE